jgi:hypothetical protein
MSDNGTEEYTVITPTGMTGPKYQAKSWYQAEEMAKIDGWTIVDWFEGGEGHILVAADV